MRWTRQRQARFLSCGRMMLSRTAKPCGPGAPTLASSLRQAMKCPDGPFTACASDGGNKARSPGRARSKPLKPLRRKRRTAPAEPVVTMLVCFFVSHARPRVRSAPGVSCALCFEGELCMTRARERRGKVDVCSPSLPATNAERLRKGAKATSNPFLLRGDMDCFAGARNDGRLRWPHGSRRAASPRSSP